MSQSLEQAIIKTLAVVPFPIGKTLLADILIGDEENDSIARNRLNRFTFFGSFSDVLLEEIRHAIDRALWDGLIEQFPSPKNVHWKLLRVTPKGLESLSAPQKQTKIIALEQTAISEQEQKSFAHYASFLEGFTDEQKKAIVTPASHVCCIAGAGSGKTTVLTKRIEWLITHQHVAPETVLAITFTRKARVEMYTRLKKLNIHPAIETFNSWCEKLLKSYESEIYARPMRIMSFQEKIYAFKHVLTEIGIEPETLVASYWAGQNKETKTNEQLFLGCMQDCYSVLEQCKMQRKPLEDFSKDAPLGSKNIASTVYLIVSRLISFMQTQGFRDYTDQLIDTVSFFKKHPEKIPRYTHILVDEYQDVNDIQVELLDLLRPKNLFIVGDPRQSIFGWRGSNISYILEFNKKYPQTETIYLTHNHRSTQPIVHVGNLAIKSMQLPDLIATKIDASPIQLLQFQDERTELLFIREALKVKPVGVRWFILARTNRQLTELSKMLLDAKIAHVIRTEEHEQETGEITLGTVHAMKGLEAEHVLVIGCTDTNFPCRVSDHPVLELIKTETYDRDAEERRLFYVALTRAKEALTLTYSGKRLSYFITPEMRKCFEE